VRGRAAARRGERQGDFVGGKYLLENCLGVGGMGDVYRATNVSLGRQVAVKILSREMTKDADDVLRFLREARAAAAVRHPNVVDVLDVARDDDGTPFIVQELLAGEDLEQYLAACGGRLSAEEALEIMVPVCDAVAAAHARDVIHRDLKPANIFLARSGNSIVPKVLDFGACFFPTLSGLHTKELKLLIGTPQYMAPEQITSRGAVDARADVWSIGIILYELLVGETPFEAETATAVLQLVKTREVPPLCERAKKAPAELESLVAVCTRQDPKYRPADAGALLERMRDVLEVVRGSLHPPRADLFSGHPPSSRGPAVLTIAEERPSEPPALGEGPASVPNVMDVPALDLPDLEPPAPPRAAPPPAPRQAARPVATLDAPFFDDDLPPASSEQRLVALPSSDLTEDADRSAPGEMLDLDDVDPAVPSGLDLELPGVGRSGAPPGSRPALDPWETFAPSAPRPDRPRPPGPARPWPDSEGSSAPASVRAPRTPALPFAPSHAAWTPGKALGFAVTALVPAALGWVVLPMVPAAAVPLAAALRGESAIATGVLAIGSLVLATVLFARAMSAQRAVSLFVAAGSAVLLGVLMIVATFAASEATGDGSVPGAAAVAPFVAPFVALGVAVRALWLAWRAWPSRYERREGMVLALGASLLLLAAVALGPTGAVAWAPPAAVPASR
jgi:eukaryotic-like serine/threonine-protein kinase